MAELGFDVSPPWIAARPLPPAEARSPAPAQSRRAPEAACVSGYILSVDADFDLDEIWEFIAADDIDAADHWIERLFDAFEALGQTPGMGHRTRRSGLLPPEFYSGPSAST